MRAKYQVLVLPYKIADSISYCIFRRSDTDCWQFVAGGGETEDITVMASAKREAFEEAGIPMDAKLTQLETRCSISTECFRARAVWGADCLVIPEYAFAVEMTGDIQISDEHTEFLWVDYDTAMAKLRYDSNKVALWELDNKLRMGRL